VVWVSPVGAGGVPAGVGGGAVLIVAVVVVLAVPAVVAVEGVAAVVGLDCVAVLELVRGVEVVCEGLERWGGAAVVGLVGSLGCVGLLAGVVEVMAVVREDELAPHPPAARTSTASSVARQRRSRIGPTGGRRRH